MAINVLAHTPMREMGRDYMGICHVNPTPGVGNLLLTGGLMCTCSVLLNVRPGRRDRSVSRFVCEYMLFIHNGEGGLGVSTKPNERSSIFSK